jgi:hypothetical protein
MITISEIKKYFNYHFEVEIKEYKPLGIIQIIDVKSQESIFLQIQPFFCRFQLRLIFMAYKDFFKSLSWKVCYYTFLQFTEMQRITNQKNK